MWIHTNQSIQLTKLFLTFILLFLSCLLPLLLFFLSLLLQLLFFLSFPCCFLYLPSWYYQPIRFQVVNIIWRWGHLDWANYPKISSRLALLELSEINPSCLQNARRPLKIEGQLLCYKQGQTGGRWQRPWGPSALSHGTVGSYLESEILMSAIVE